MEPGSGLGNCEAVNQQFQGWSCRTREGIQGKARRSQNACQIGRELRIMWKSRVWIVGVKNKPKWGQGWERSHTVALSQKTWRACGWVGLAEGNQEWMKKTKRQLRLLGSQASRRGAILHTVGPPHPTSRWFPHPPKQPSPFPHPPSVGPPHLCLGL